MSGISSKGSISSFFRSGKTVLFKIACEVFLCLSGNRKSAQIGANTLQYRTEQCDLSDIPSALRGVSILFLTDLHIGGNIDSLAPEISKNIHNLLRKTDPGKTLILHGGDFICSDKDAISTSDGDFLRVSTQLFEGLSDYPQFGVIGNHDQDNCSFPVVRKYLEHDHAITLLETPEDVQNVDINETTLRIHGIHTLSTFLHNQPKIQRNTLLDRYIVSLNSDSGDCNVVLIHNPDGLEFLLRRLRETSQILQKPTLFLAGHTHGAMFDIPVLRHIGLMTCKTRYGRYKGWYGPDSKYADTGNWKLYVSTGMGNSGHFSYRINADPEVVLLKL